VFGRTRRNANADAMGLDPIRDNTDRSGRHVARRIPRQTPGRNDWGVASLHFVGFVDQQLISAHRHYAALRKDRVPS
jgi:hypothetical protein